MVELIGRAIGMTSMDMPLIIGGMPTGDEPRARRLAMVVHVVMMGTLVFGILYGLLFTPLDSHDPLAGLVIGLIHGLLFGAMVLPMMTAPVFRGLA